MCPGERARRTPGRRRAAGGFAYLWLLFFLAFMGVNLAASGVVWEVRVRREKEADLLSIGRQFQRAVADYYRLSPQAAKELPRRLEDLVEDRRALVTRRHLRRVYPDPLTGKAEWGLVSVNGRIAGVYSLAKGVPIRRRGFGDGEEDFANADSYAQWRFVARDLPAAGAGAGTAGANPGAASNPPPGAAPGLPANVAAPAGTAPAIPQRAEE